MKTYEWKEDVHVPLCNNEGEEGTNWEDVTVMWECDVLDDGYMVKRLVSVEIHPKAVLQ